MTYGQSQSFRAMQQTKQPEVLFEKAETAIDSERQCWLALNPHSKIVHAITVPWIERTDCRGRAVSISGWHRWWGDRARWLTCHFCRMEPTGNLAGMLPPQFTLESRDEALIAADWWLERGDERKAEALLKLARLKYDRRRGRLVEAEPLLP